MSRRLEYARWYNMLQRCENPKNVGYCRYGARGIKVCKAWHDFETYRADLLRLIGPRPHPNLSIDRINNDGDYEPGNVRWATPKEQTMNSRLCGPQSETYYGKIANQLRAKIQSGEITGQLPTLWALVNGFTPRPGYNTVRKAIKVLLDEGLVETSPRGTFLRKDSAQPPS